MECLVQTTCAPNLCPDPNQKTQHHRQGVVASKQDKGEYEKYQVRRRERQQALVDQASDQP
jgi:hypothetical protein